MKSTKVKVEMVYVFWSEHYKGGENKYFSSYEKANNFAQKIKDAMTLLGQHYTDDQFCIDEHEVL